MSLNGGDPDYDANPGFLKTIALVTPIALATGITIFIMITFIISLGGGMRSLTTPTIKNGVNSNNKNYNNSNGYNIKEGE